MKRKKPAISFDPDNIPNHLGSNRQSEIDMIDKHINKNGKQCIPFKASGKKHIMGKKSTRKAVTRCCRNGQGFINYMALEKNLYDLYFSQGIGYLKI